VIRSSAGASQPPPPPELIMPVGVPPARPGAASAMHVQPVPLLIPPLPPVAAIAGEIHARQHDIAGVGEDAATRPMPAPPPFVPPPPARLSPRRSRS